MTYTIPLSAVKDPTQCYLLTNGLGGYCSTAADFSTPRADHAILSAAVKAPNLRIVLVHWLTEQLVGGEALALKEFSYDYTCATLWKIRPRLP